MIEEARTPRLRRALGFGDLLLYFVVTSFGIRWVATAAAAGPGAVTVWVLGCLTFYVPLVFCVLELAARHPEEGGLYVWSQRAFGDFAGFMTGWTYWTSILPYFSGVLYFIAGNALFIGGARWQHLADYRGYFIAVSLGLLAVTTAINLVGLQAGKWLHNLGAVGTWLPALALIIIGAAIGFGAGAARQLSLASFVPAVSLKDLVFWSTIAFAFTGAEAAPIMGEEIKDPRRNLPRALLAAGVVVTLSYILATLAVIVALPEGEVSSLQGVAQAAGRAGGRLGLDGLAPLVAASLSLGLLGQVSAWTAAGARLPFVAGVDRFLPAAFARLHPRWGTPYAALLTQSAVVAALVLLGQAGTTVKGAYDVLVSMALIPTFIPFLFVFAAVIKLQREPAGAEVWRVPGGRPVATLLAALGFTTTVVAIILALIPPEGEANKWLAVSKVVGLAFVLLGVGVAVYLMGRRRVSATLAARQGN